MSLNFQILYYLLTTTTSYLKNVDSLTLGLKEQPRHITIDEVSLGLKEQPRHIIIDES